MARHADPQASGRDAEAGGEARAVDAPVVEDVRASDAELLGELRVGRGLRVVGRDDPDEAAPAGGRVARGIASGRSGAGTREADVGVGRADHRQWPARGAVEDRYLQ